MDSAPKYKLESYGKGYGPRCENTKVSEVSTVTVGVSSELINRARSSLSKSKSPTYAVITKLKTNLIHRTRRLGARPERGLASTPPAMVTGLRSLTSNYSLTPLNKCQLENRLPLADSIIFLIKGYVLRKLTERYSRNL